MTFEDLGLSAALLKAVKNEGLHRAHADPGAGDRPRARRPRPVGRGPDRHRQDGRLRAADLAAARPQHGPATRGARPRRRACSCSRRRASWPRKSPRASPPTAGTPGCKQAVIYGGVSQNPQAKAVRDGVDILVATPGRLLDLMKQGSSRWPAIEMLVLDEADRMLDMGFIRDIRKIVAKLPTKRQTLLFSATMPADIRQLADTHSDRIRCAVHVAAKKRDGRHGRAVGVLRREAEQAGAADALARDRPA